MGLYIGPRRERRGRKILLLAVVVLIVTGLFAWQRGWLPQEAFNRLETIQQRILLPISPVSSPLSAQPQPDETGAMFNTEAKPVILVSTDVVENPQSDAYTADLYRDTNADQTIPWPNAGGRAKVETYTVQEGDTLWSIAAQFELDIDTLRWSNPDLERNPDIVSVGTELVILPVQGIYHRVKAGDTIAAIAARYGVAEADITNYPPNGLYPPYDLKAGQGVIVPFGRKELNVPQPSLSPETALAWPLVGPITQGYHPDHLAIDIGGPYGATVYAAGDGEVIYARWAETGYGYTIIIDHGAGMQTWYSHLKGTFLQSGFVARGNPIGEVGSTGRSSGPHVHFEVRINKEQVNPLEYLPDSPN
ncbi:MAG: peptidoglycan DD-metalloendopeptidase family protein [Anaerolineae bacterium]|nr:peptidoglycan DD-metalloendopeptidase family protein [Anaerolineae bacterium]